MANQIIKQPNGKYCVFSSVVDNIISYDMDKQDIIDESVDEYRKEITERVNGIIDSLERGDMPYYQFTMDHVDMLNKIKEIHGHKESKKIKDLISTPRP